MDFFHILIMLKKRKKNLLKFFPNQIVVINDFPMFQKDYQYY